MKDLIVQENEQLKGIDDAKSAQIKAVFQPMVEMLESFEEKYKKVTALEISPDKCKQAKRLRLDISRVRIDADKVRKTQKEEYIRAGNAIQGVYNILKFAVTDKEEKLKDIETHFERIEEVRKSQLQLDRSAELAKYEANGEFVDLGNMPDEVWKNYLAGVKNNYESIKEAERKAEEERVEAIRIDSLGRERRESIYDLWQFMPDKNKSENFGKWADDMWDELVNYLNKCKADHDAEQEKIKAENERLRLENEKAEKKRLADQKRISKEREVQENKLKAEREAREKLEREQAKKEAERLKTEREKTAEEKKAASAPDKEKLFSVAQKLMNTKTTVKSPVAKKALEDAATLIQDVAEAM